MSSRARQVYNLCEGWMIVREIEAAIGLPPTNRERQALRQALGWLRKKGLAESSWQDGRGTLWRVREGGDVPTSWLDRPTTEEALGDGMTIKELAEATGRTEASVASSLRKLERKGRAWGERIPGRRQTLWHRGQAPQAEQTDSEGDNGAEARVQRGRRGRADAYEHVALRMSGGGVRNIDRIGQAPLDVPVREPAQVEARTMARVPLVPCVLCDQVPGMPDRLPSGIWHIVCPICGREAKGTTSDEVRQRWAEFNAKRPKPLSTALDLLDTIESAMCDLEAIRTVPGAMDIWHRWMDDLCELRELISKGAEE